MWHWHVHSTSKHKGLPHLCPSCVLVAFLYICLNTYINIFLFGDVKLFWWPYIYLKHVINVQKTTNIKLSCLSSMSVCTRLKWIWSSSVIYPGTPVLNTRCVDQSVGHLRHSQKVIWFLLVYFVYKNQYIHLKVVWQ